MVIKHLLGLWLLSSILLLSNRLTAAESSAVEQHDHLKLLLDLSLEELMKVTVASRREESVVDAPGIVSVVTAEDIQKLGYRNLRDILNRQTSLQIVGSNLFPHNKTNLRGVSTSHTENKVLLLINGRPVREATLSSINHDLYNFFPVDAIQRIEIIRGPGSVLYGTNAFSGVINIITYNGGEQWQGKLSAKLGSFDTEDIQGTFGGELYGVNVFGALHHMNTDAGDFPNITDEFGQRQDYPIGAQGTQGFLELTAGGFKLETLYSDTDTDNVRSVFAYPADRHSLQRTFVDAGYQYELNSAWQIDSHLAFHQVNSTFDALPEPTPPAETAKAYNYRAEVIANGQLSTNLRLLAGVDYEKSKNTEESIANTYTHSLYAQIDYQWLSWFKWILGAQYNKPDAISGEVSPRLGAIMKLGENWGTKLLYSSAFRHASPLERFIDNPAIQGNPLLQPETIDTFDAQWFYYKDTTSFTITAFHSKQKSIITRQAGTPAKIVNGGYIRFRGVELEGRMQPASGLTLLGNASYQTNESGSGVKDVTYAPNTMVKLGGYFETQRSIIFSLFGSYFGASARQNETAIHLNPEADAYTLLTANIEANLGTLFKNQSLMPFSVSLYGDNLLDEDIYFPSMHRPTVNSLPHHPGRGFYLTLTAEI